MFLKKMNRFLSKIPVSIRVTAWFSSVIVILFLIVLSALILIEDKFVNDLSQKELIEAVEEIYENPEKFENFNDGIYYIKYNNQNEIITGKFPKDFDIALLFSMEDINIYQVKNKKFLYYDTRLENEDNWIRGIYPLSKVQKEMELLWSIAIILCALFIIFVVIFGYRIIKNAFKPVKQISDTALEIKKSKDFSNRINLESGYDEIHKMASTFNEMLDTVEEVFIHEKQFSSDVSHELRTPITVILAQSDYALQYSDSLEDAKESLEVINRHAKRMSNLINQIMELSKLERQKEIEKERLNLSNLVVQLLEDYKPLLESRNLNLIYNVEKDIRIQGNKVMLERVFLNILMNAVKFTKTNVEVSLTRNDKIAILKIRDDGIGISEENKKFIWERFFQVNDSRNKEENKGSGLGLSMVKKIVDLHSATIDLESELDLGTCFIIKFKIQ